MFGRLRQAAGRVVNRLRQGTANVVNRVRGRTPRTTAPSPAGGRRSGS